jgi:nitroreductase
MDIIKAIAERKSIRAFKPDPVSKDILKKILELSCRAPSSVNQQPWEFAVIAGEPLEELKRLNVEKTMAGIPAQRDYPTEERPKESIYRKRQVALAMEIFTLMGIERENREKRLDWLLRGMRYFDAPAAIIIYSDRCLREAGPLLDIGAVMQSICLAALAFGLGTCIENQGIQYSNALRECIGIPETKRIAVSIAIGYPDADFPANRLYSSREPIENITLWRGFEPV